MLKYLWQATFKDGTIIRQPLDDCYSKHDDNAEHNPSAFRDIIEYQEKSPLEYFALYGRDNQVFAVNIKTGKFYVNGTTFMLDQPMEELKDRKLIYFRTGRMDMHTGKGFVYAYNIGYEGKDNNGKIAKKVITVR